MIFTFVNIPGRIPDIVKGKIEAFLKVETSVRANVCSLSMIDADFGTGTAVLTVGTLIDVVAFNCVSRIPFRAYRAAIAFFRFDAENVLFPLLVLVATASLSGIILWTAASESRRTRGWTGGRGRTTLSRTSCHCCRLHLNKLTINLFPSYSQFYGC